MRLLGIDIGGTFTDLVLLADGQLTVHKRLSSPATPATSLLAGVAELGGAPTIVHGSTVATNALLERRGAATAFVATAGFGDLLAIGRGDRPTLYDLAVQAAPPLVPGERCVELAERTLADGSVLQPLAEPALAALVAQLAAWEVEAVAICLLHSYANPSHEARVVAALAERAPQLYVSASHHVLPAFREYERASTTTINAYVGPLMQRYLAEVAAGLPAQTRLRVVGSDGGSMSVATAGQLAARTALSGPAAGVVGARYVAGVAGYDRLITFDMGGTSTDVALVPGELPLSRAAQIGGLPLALPTIDISTVGAGGGSIARVDASGALRVGPHSAGADPGPAAYGRGDLPTVTDANVALGRLPADHFLGGRMTLHPARAAGALGRLGAALGRDLPDTALGVVRVANAAMERAIRTISVERGDDPRDCTLVAFGGAGPLHAVALAETLGMKRVLVPRYPGVLSALGMLAADAAHDLTRAILRPWPAVEPASLLALAAELATGAAQLLAADGVAPAHRRLSWQLSLRYAGQGFELVLPLAQTTAEPPPASALAEVPERFHALHERHFGHAMPWRPLELVALGCRAVGLATPPDLRPPALPLRTTLRPLDVRPATLDQRPAPTPIYARDDLRPGDTLPGPLLVVQLDATTVVPAGWRAAVDDWLNLLLEPHAA